MSGHGTITEYRYGCRCDSCKEAQSVWNQRYQRANRDRISDMARRYKDENRDRIAERDRAYQEKNRDRIRARERQYREAVGDQVRARRAERASVERSAASRIGEPWTQAEDQMLRTSEMAVRELAFALGRTSQTIYTRRRQLGIAKRRAA